MSTGSGGSSDLVMLGTVSDIGHPGRQATCIWIREGRIHAVGNSEVLAEATSSGARVVDHGTRYLSPGFVDPHAHVEAFSTALDYYVDLRFPRVASVQQALEVLADAVENSDDGWIIAQANLFWNDKLAEKRYPTLAELDAVSTERPIAIRAGGHVSILNSAAINLSGIANYSDNAGMMGRAIIERDENGRLTGKIAELDAFLPLPEYRGEKLRQVMRDGIRENFTAHGVTTIGEIAETRAGAEAVRDLGLAGALTSRIALFLWNPGAFSAEDIEREAPSYRTDGLVSLVGVKMFADGGFSSRNAAVLTPYLGDGAATESANGDLNLSPEQLVEALTLTERLGLQLAVHTNGERAQQAYLEAIERYTAEHGAPLRAPRLEHFANLLTSEDTIAQFERTTAIGVTQPTFIYTFAGLLPALLGAPAERGRHPYRDARERGLRIAASSDVHMGGEIRQTDPLFGIWAMMARESFDGSPVEPEQAITAAEALELYTLAGAESIGMAADIGSLTEGKLADIAVFSADISAATVTSIGEIRAEVVYLGGKEVFRR